jgi:hypothetical protein
MALLATVLALLAPPSSFAISYERSGGLKPMPQKLVISPGRHGALTTRGADLESSRTVRFRVGVRRIESLQRALAQSDFATVGTPGPNPGTCADCYFYSLRYEGHEVTFSEVSVPEQLRGVVGQLEAVIAAHRPFH